MRRICIECKWCDVVEDAFGGARCEYNCTHDEAVNRVTGEPTSCDEQRSYGVDGELDFCTKSGHWYEPAK